MMTRYRKSLFSSLKTHRFFLDNGKIVLASLFLACLLSHYSYAQPEGSLQMKLYVIETTGIPEKAGEMDKHFDNHIAHQIDLEKRGIMFGAGPLYNEGSTDGPPMTGMIIIRASSFNEAKEIADSDPMHIHGIRSYSIRQWSLNEGTFNVRVNFSDQSVEFK